MTAVATIPPMSPCAIDRVRRLEAVLSELPQVEFSTEHVFHAGLYARTICIPAGAVLTGAEIKIATLLIVSGAATIYLDGETLEVSGYHVIPAGAGRKQAIVARADTNLTMLFSTQARTVADAENEFSDEGDMLRSRIHPGRDTVIITEDTQCQA
jgi:hypothetical protein